MLRFDDQEAAGLSRPQLDALRDSPKEPLVSAAAANDVYRGRQPGALSYFFTNVTKDNVGQVRLLNDSLFPVRYKDQFYRELYAEDAAPVVRLCKHGELSVGAICSRLEAFDLGQQDRDKGWTPEDQQQPSEAAVSSSSAASAPSSSSGSGKGGKKKKKGGGGGGGATGAAGDAFAGAAGRPKRLYIMTLGVLPAYRRFGLASKLLASVLGHALARPEIRYVYLHVKTDNRAGLRFYEQFGFRITHTIEGYYKDLQPPDCYVLRRDLGPADRESLADRQVVVPDYTLELDGAGGGGGGSGGGSDLFGDLDEGGSGGGKKGKKGGDGGQGGGGGGKKKGGGGGKKGKKK